MNYAPVKNLLRRFLNNGAIYSYTRRALLLGQYLLKIPDEPDFKVFKVLRNRDRGMFVDIGANAGQSAIAFAFLCPKFRITSFEPNPALWRELAFVKRLLGARFEYHRCGLADQEGQLQLYLPMLGRLPISTRASLSLDGANHQAEKLQTETGRTATVQSFNVDIKRFDDFHMTPDVVKIDVEGVELQVLTGMRKTISACRPIIMLERNEDTPHCKAFLKDYGYRFYERDSASGKLTKEPVARARNWFAVPSGSEIAEPNDK